MLCKKSFVASIGLVTSIPARVKAQRWALGLTKEPHVIAEGYADEKTPFVHTLQVVGIFYY